MATCVGLEKDLMLIGALGCRKDIGVRQGGEHGAAIWEQMFQPLGCDLERLNRVLSP